MRTLALKRRRDLSRRKWQYGAAALTVFLGTMAYAASYDAYRNLDSSYRRLYDRLRLADATVTGADDSLVTALRQHPSIDEVETRRQADVPLRVDGEHTLVGRLVAVPSNRPRVNLVDVVEGDAMDPDRTDQALVEWHMFDYFGIDVGDTVEYFDGFQWQDVAVAGAALSPEYVWPARSAQDAFTTPDSFGVLFVHEDVLASLFAPSTDDQVLVAYHDGAKAGRADSAVARAARRAEAASVVLQADQPSNKALQADILGFQQMAYAFPALFMVAAAVATYTLMSRLVYQERELIGTLRANGLSRRQVVRHYLSYGAWLGGLAGVLGVAVGIPLGWLFTSAYTSELGIPDIPRSMHWTTLAVGALFGLGTGLISAYLPARDASRQDPAEAMRGDMSTVAGRRSLLERFVPIARRLPVRWRMVLRGVERNRRRSLSTIVGVVLALVLLLAAWGLLDSTRYLLWSQYEDTQVDDAAVVFTRPVDDSAVDLVALVRGVDSAERVVALPASVKHGRDAYGTQLVAFRSDTAMHRFDEPLPPEGVILGDSLRDRLSLEEGDTVELALTSLATTVRVPVAGFVDEPLGTFAYMRDDALVDALADARPPVAESRLEQPESSVVLARFASEADRESVVERLKALDGVAAVRDSHQLQRLLEDYLGLFYVFIGFMLAFGGILAFALLFNMMWANLAERAAEIATMRANGHSQRQIAVLMVWENLLLVLAGIPLGAVAGYAVARALMASYTTDSWAYELHFAPMTFVWCAAAMVIVALCALWPSLRAAERLDVGSIVRQRSA